MKKIMILGASILQLPAIIKARDLGLYVIALDRDPNAVGFMFSDKHYLVSTIDEAQVLKVAEEEKIDGIMTLATDLPMKAVAKTAEKLNLVSISSETAIITTNKFKMRERLALSHIPIPDYQKITSLEEFYYSIKKFGKHFIVKPTENSGSRGVYLVRTKDQHEKAFYHAMGNSMNGEIVIEEYMKGNEVSVETLSLDKEVFIIAITDKLTTGAPYFVEMGHTQPAQFDELTLQKIKKTATDAIIALGIENGPSHTEIMVTDEGPKIVEVGARLGGDYITSHLVPLSTGVDMVDCCIKIALGEKPDLMVNRSKASAIRYLKTYGGRIQFIEGVEEASSIEGVHEVTLNKKAGDIINDIHCSTDRIGFVITSGNEVKDAINACEKAMGMIKVNIVPVE